MEVTKSLLEIAVENMAGKKNPQNIYNFLDEVLSLAGISEEDESYLDEKAQLYTDMVTSSLFVYCGEDQWNLKEKESLDVYDRDASFYNQNTEDDEDDDKELSLKDFELDSDDASNDIDEEDEDEEDEDKSYDDEYYEDDDYDEDKYNDVMDDYEDLYDR